VDAVDPAPRELGHVEDDETDHEVGHGESHEHARNAPRLPLVSVVLEQAQT
jgi:hypothetical protein